MTGAAGPPGPAGDLAAELERVQLRSETLYAVIGAVAASPDLDHVLDGIVELLSEATDCHACFVYLRDGDRLRLRAASRIYRHLVGRLEWGVDEGLTGWVARTKAPAFIRDEALQDPRMKYVPEIEEERFQSMVAVPVPARSGEVLGVVVLHTVAPREFDEGVLTFLSHTASLVAGAIENARLYEESRRRVEGLTELSRLAQRIAAVTRRDELYRTVTEGVRRLLAAERCQLFELDADGARLELVAADPAERRAPWPGGEGAEILLDLVRRSGPRGAAAGTRAPDGGDGALLAVAVEAGGAPLGVLAVGRERRFGDAEDELLRAVGHQLAVALEKARLIERLTAENIVRDLFDALARGDADVAAARASAAGVDLEQAFAILHALPGEGDSRERPWPAVVERAEAGLRRLAPGMLVDAGPDSLRGLLPLPPRDGDEPARLDELEAELDALGATHGLALGFSSAQQGAAAGRRGVREAVDAAHVAQALQGDGGAIGYDALGVYKYLVHLRLDDAPRDRHWTAIERLIAYDAQRQARLVETLEHYLQARRSVTTTARQLYIHPNTLRQRLNRIEQLTGLELATEDLLALELAVKLVRLRAVGSGGAADG